MSDIRLITFNDAIHSRASGAFNVETGQSVGNNIPRVIPERIPYNTWSPKLFYAFSPGETWMRYDATQDPDNNLVARKSQFETEFPEFTKVNLGSSSGGTPRPIDAYRLGPLGRKHFVVLCGVHGNEIDGVNGTFKAIEILAREPEFQSFRNEWTLFFVPAMNPDGWFLDTRNLDSVGPNGQTINLNRNWDWFWDEYVETSNESKGSAPESTNEAQSLLNYFRGTGPFTGQGAQPFGFLMDQHANEGVGKRYQSRDRIWRSISEGPADAKNAEVLPGGYLSVYFDYYLWRSAMALTKIREREENGPDRAIAYLRSRFRPHLHSYFSSLGIPSIAIEEVKVDESFNNLETFSSAANFRLDYTIAAAAIATSSNWIWEDAVLLEKAGRNILKNSHFEQWQSGDTRPGNYTTSRSSIQRNTNSTSNPASIRHYDDSGEALTLTSQTDIRLRANPSSADIPSEFVRVANAKFGTITAISPEMTGLWRFDIDAAFETGFVGSPDLVLSHSQRTGSGLSYAFDSAVDIIGGGTSAPSTGDVSTITRISNIDQDVPTQSSVGNLNTARMFHAICDNFLSFPIPSDVRAFIFGGFSGGLRTNTIEIWNPDTTTSTNSGSTIPGAGGTQNIAEACAVYHPGLNRVYIFGGSDDLNSTRTAILDYNVSGDTISVHSTPMIVALKNMAGAYSPIDGRIWIFGGEDSVGDMSDKIYSFDPATGAFVEEEVTQNLGDDEDSHDGDNATWVTRIGRWGAVTLVENAGDDGFLHAIGGRIIDTLGAKQAEVYQFDPVDEIIGIARFSDYGYIRFNIPVSEKEYEPGEVNTHLVSVENVTGRAFIDEGLTFSPSGATAEFLELVIGHNGETLMRVKTISGVITVSDSVINNQGTFSADVLRVGSDPFASFDETIQWLDLEDQWQHDAGNGTAKSDQSAGTSGILIWRGPVDYINNRITGNVRSTGGGDPPSFSIYVRGVSNDDSLTFGYKVTYDFVNTTWEIRRVRYHAETVIWSKDVTAIPSEQITTSARDFDLRVEDRDPVLFSLVFNGQTIFTQLSNYDAGNDRITGVGDVGFEGGESGGNYVEIDDFQIQTARWKDGGLSGSVSNQSGDSNISGYVRQTLITKDESALSSSDQTTFLRYIRNYYTIPPSDFWNQYRNRVDFEAGKRFNREDGARYYNRLYKDSQTVHIDGMCVVEGLIPHSFIHPDEDFADETMTFPGSVPGLDNFSLQLYWMPTFSFCDLVEDLELLRVERTPDNYICLKLIAGDHHQREYNLNDVYGPHQPLIRLEKVRGGIIQDIVELEGFYFGYTMTETSIEAQEDFVSITISNHTTGGVGLRVERNGYVGEATSRRDQVSFKFTGASDIKYTGAGYYSQPRLVFNDSQSKNSGRPNRRIPVKNSALYKRLFGRYIDLNLGGESDPTNGQIVSNLPYIETDDFNRIDSSGLGSEWGIITETGAGWDIESNKASCTEEGFRYWANRFPAHADYQPVSKVTINNTGDLVGHLLRVDLDGISSRDVIFGYGVELLETGANSASVQVVRFYNGIKDVLITGVLSSYTSGTEYILRSTTNGTIIIGEVFDVSDIDFETPLGTATTTDNVYRKPGRVGIYGQTGGALQKVTLDDWSLSPNFNLRRTNMGFGPTPDSWLLRSDKDVHYTTLLAQNAIDLENIGALPTPAVIITRVTVWSDQNLDWDIMFFRNATSQPNADIDLDAMVDWISFAVADGVQVAGTGPYRYSVSGITLRYQPDDGDAHVALINRNAVDKNAGATGEIAIELQGPVL